MKYGVGGWSEVHARSEMYENGGTTCGTKMAGKRWNEITITITMNDQLWYEPGTEPIADG